MISYAGCKMEYMGKNGTLYCYNKYSLPVFKANFLTVYINS